MTQEEKLEEAKRLYETANADQKYVLERLFPELKESEDELTWLTKYIEEEAYYLSMDIRGNEDRIKLENLRKSLAWLEKQGEQKSLDDIVKEVIKDKDAAISFLKSCGIMNENGELADEYKIEQGEPNPAWSEEDEDYCLDVNAAVDDYCAEGYAEELHDWLESLKDRVQPQNRWKPSDEQIKVCKEVYADILSAKGFDVGAINSELNRMEKQLKKLKGE